MENSLYKSLIHVFKDCGASYGTRQFDSLPADFQTKILDLLKSKNIPVDNLGEVIELPIPCIANERDGQEVCLVSVFFDDEQGDMGVVRGNALFSYEQGGGQQKSELLFENIGG